MSSTGYGLKSSLLQKKKFPCTSTNTASSGRGCHSMCRPRVFATVTACARPVLGSVFARPRAFATTRVFARPASGSVFTRPRVVVTMRAFATDTHMTSLRDVSLPEQCAQEVPSDTHMSSLREVPSPGMCLQTPTCLRWPRCLRKLFWGA